MSANTVQQKGLFITLEGIEGVGKSTCLKFIDKYLYKKNIPHLITREPGGTPFAEEIRGLLLHRLEEKILPETELLLLFAGRNQHLHHIILPALEKGLWVISDRFTDASYAYQGGGRGVPEEHIQALEKIIQNKFTPHVTLLLDAPVKRALHRTLQRRHHDRIEQEKESFFKKTRKAYLQRAKAYPQRFIVINAGKPLTMVKKELSAKFDYLIAVQGE